MNRQKQNTNAYDEKTRKRVEMRRIWQSRADKIQHPVITHKPKPGEDFRYETVASSLPHRQKPSTEQIEKKEGETAELVTERYVAYDDDDEVFGSILPTVPYRVYCVEHPCGFIPFHQQISPTETG